jgi:hypothetical protein
MKKPTWSSRTGGTKRAPIQRFRSAGPMTLNNPTEEEIEHLRKVTSLPMSKIKYICFCHENKTREGHTYHLQIYAQAHEKLSVKAWHDQLGQRISCIQRTDHTENAHQYCKGFEKKEDSFFKKVGSEEYEEFGVAPQQGERTDIQETAHAVSEMGLKQMNLQLLHQDVLAKYPGHFKDLNNTFRTEHMRIAAQTEHDKYYPNRNKQPWEETLYDIVAKEPNPREIHWFVDEVGNTNKTLNAKQLIFHHNAFVSTGGKANDIIYAYEGEPIVVLNLVASVDKDTTSYLYKVLESFKDGLFSSGKYTSCSKVFPIPHVIVFSNDRPDEDKMKVARLIVHDIQEINNRHSPNAKEQDSRKPVKYAFPEHATAAAKNAIEHALQLKTPCRHFEHRVKIGSLIGRDTN